MQRIFIFIVSLSLTQLLIGQTSVYHPLPDSGYYWHVIDLTSECATGLSDTIGADFIYYTISGDTTVASKKYKKVFATNDSYDFIYPRGYLYEDTINRKIYMVTDDPFDYTITGDTLLYDFNIEVGTSVDDFYEFYGFTLGDPANSIVFGIDSIEIEGSYRKRIGIKYEIHQCDDKNPVKIDTLYWIEGIGSTAGLTSPDVLPLNPGGEYAVDVLACVFKNDSVVYSNNHNWHTCDTVFIDFSSIANHVPAASLILYPQPSNYSVSLELKNNHIHGGAAIQISDIWGRLIFSTSFNSDEMLIIPTEEIISGIYILTVTSKYGLLLSSKLIVQH